MLFTLQISKLRYVFQFKFHHLMMQPDIRYRRAVSGPHWTYHCSSKRAGTVPYVWLGYELVDRWIFVRFHARSRYFSVPRSIKTVSGDQRAT